MQIEILIEGEKKTFTTAIIPMLARRKFMEIRAKEEELIEEHGMIPPKEQIELDNELINVLVDVIFKNQFTVDELLNGVSDDYFNEKISEALFGKVEEEEKDTGK